MTRQKINTRFLLLLPLFAALYIWSFPGVSHAQDYILQQKINGTTPPPTDVCLNIDGVQTSVPTGMEVDASGNCYTPAPPPVPPTTTDLCANLTGTQSTLPAGYYRTTAGNCYAQPSPPTPTNPIVDVCPNIEGSQSVIPEGYYLTTNNTCEQIPIVTDVCPNIPGPQATIPGGMKLTDNECYTPPTPTPQNSAPTSGTTTQNTSEQNKTPGVTKNIPSFLQPPIQTLVNLVPEPVREWLRALPGEVAQTVPYYIFIMVAILALIPILQSIREALFVRQLALILKRERDIAEQKDNFVALASHYLRTPLTLMKSGLDTINSLGEVPAEATNSLQLQLNSLDAGVKDVLDDVESNNALKGVADPIANVQITPVWRSGWFWGPIVASVILTILANFFLAVVGDKEIGITNQFFQFLVAAVAFVILYLGVRNMHLQKRLREENQMLIDHEKTVDEARNAFISSTTATLQQGLEPITNERSIIANAPSAKFFDEGYERIEAMLQKFLLLSQVQTGVDRNLETFDLHEAIDNLLVTYGSAISEKKLTVANMTTTTFIKQNRLLFNFVLGSILDNAIKFNQEGGSIEINAEPSSKMLSIKVSDNGIGIEADKLGQLFKPFSRATSAVEFNYEGLGFSLFLDKIIMDYTGGNISAQSAFNEGTELLLTTPLTTNV